MHVAIIDYGSGNLRSVAKALERVGATVRVTSEAGDLDEASHIVLPGVGAFADCAAGIKALPGMVERLERAALKGGRPFLGICVGMQLMATAGHEHGRHPGLGWIPGEVVPIEPGPLKVPHIGWNELSLTRPDHPVFAALGPGAHVYFVHGYQFRPADPAAVVASADYGGPLVAAVARDNLVGTQFHPEKSQAAGLAFLAAFLAWRP